MVTDMALLEEVRRALEPGATADQMRQRRRDLLPRLSSALAQRAAVPDGLKRERQTIAEKAREWAGHYKPHSDGRNTFILFAEWIDSRIVHDAASPQPQGAGEEEADPFDYVSPPRPTHKVHAYPVSATQDRGAAETIAKAALEWNAAPDGEEKLAATRRLIAVCSREDWSPATADELMIIRREVGEECAKIAEETLAYDDMLQVSAGCRTTGQRIAHAIRALTTAAPQVDEEPGDHY